MVVLNRTLAWGEVSKFSMETNEMDALSFTCSLIQSPQIPLIWLIENVAQITNINYIKCFTESSELRERFKWHNIASRRWT